MSELTVPELSLVVLVGISGSGKSTFGRTKFAATEVISSDFCRGLVADDENDQAASSDAFDVLFYIAGKRLAGRRLTVVDATNVRPDDRKKLIQLAREHDVLPVAIVLDVPESVAAARNAERADRNFGRHVLRRQADQLRRGLKGLQREGFRHVHVLRDQAEMDAATIVRTRLYTDLRHESGPFDVIGDVHGCRTELEELLGRLDYSIVRDEHGRAVDAKNPDGRRAVFLGDLVDRGPDTPGVLRLAMGMVASGQAFAVPGNHENKLLRALRGRQVQKNHGLAETLEQLDRESDEFRTEVENFIDGLISHYVLDDGRLVVCHAGLPERFHNRASGRVRSFCLYGDTTGETDEFGLPVRYPWAQDYRGSATVLYGHVPTTETRWLNNTLCLDTGCAFGGELSALRYPEREIVSVPAHEVYYEPVRPLAPKQDERAPEILELADVLGNRSVETAYHGRVSVREENAAAALEVMSRFALEPSLLPYLPPTMAPVNTSARADLLEHPAEAFTAFRAQGVDRVVCEEKHMGSRAVALVRRDGGGALYTRTGRSFFEPGSIELLLTEFRVAAADLFAELNTSWLLFDAELLPWSAKATGLLQEQYAPIGAASGASLPAALEALQSAADRGIAVDELTGRVRSREENARRFVDAYRRYCWPTDGISGVRIAPFQLLASAGATYHDRPHDWHLALADRLAESRPDLFTATKRFFLDPADADAVGEATRWWEDLTAAGGEGIVVKPAANLVRGKRGLIQPGLKVRGPEYLRIIYGPDYSDPESMARLRDRSLGHKRSMALREYALGIEALERLARNEPLWRVHECVFAVLALESEPVDPRL